MRFDAGFKMSYVKSDNKVVYDRDNGSGWVPDDRSNHFIYEENINAAYVSINKKWNKWSAQAGLAFRKYHFKRKTGTERFILHKKIYQLVSNHVPEL